MHGRGGHQNRSRARDGSERCAVGTAEIVGPAYDHAGPDGKRMPVVDVEARERFPSVVELSALKADPAFADSPLTRLPRLSFVPLTDKQYARVMALAKKKR